MGKKDQVTKKIRETQENKRDKKISETNEINETVRLT
jgi:hypothetical protein